MQASSSAITEEEARGVNTVFMEEQNTELARELDAVQRRLSLMKKRMDTVGYSYGNEGVNPGKLLSNLSDMTDLLTELCSDNLISIINYIEENERPRG